MKNWLSTSYYYFSVVLDKLALFMILRKTYAHQPQGLVPLKLTTLINLLLDMYRLNYQLFTNIKLFCKIEVYPLST